MKYNKLGNTDLDVSAICLGTMTYGEQNTEAEAHEQMDFALDNGVNFWDTAELYAVPSNPKNNGKTEEYIGSWFKKTGKREEVVLATKITGLSTFGNLSYIREDLRFNKKQINLAIEGSLKRLQTDYVDLCLEVLDAMQALVKAGKVRHFGLSNETPWGLMHFRQLAKAHGLPMVQSVQNPYSLLNRTYEVGMAEISMREQVGLLPYSPMAFGLLSGKYHNKTAREDARLHKYKVMSRFNNDNSWKATQKYLDIAEANGLSLAQMSLAFINQQPFVTANIIGATNLTQLKENIDSINVTLSKDVMKAIEEVHELIPNPAP